VYGNHLSLLLLRVGTAEKAEGRSSSTARVLSCDERCNKDPTGLDWTGLSSCQKKKKEEKKTTLFWSFICPNIGQLAKGHFG
jgi:hypothetical protein